jgi:UDP-N-acetylglucosamine 2-epimerase (non-hydrolysing)
MKLICIAGARPNFMKIAPLMDAFRRRPEVSALLVHTGQHYDEKMSDLFFRQLCIPKPDVNLEVGSGSHAVQTADIMRRFEPVVLAEKPDAVLVVGDVNSTIACGLVAVKLGVPLVHVEAGLRSFDRTMPEEINRVLTDAISDVLFCTEQSGIENLQNEGMPADRMHLVGNVMIDTLVRNRQRAEQSAILDELKVADRRYALVTLHRPSNVDHADVLEGLLGAFAEIGGSVPVIFPIHPRTRRMLKTGAATLENAGIRLVEPLGYFDFLKLVAHALVVLTDSGGIQEETTILGVPCLTLRDNTERPITVTMGTNRLVGTKPEAILTAYRDVAQNGAPRTAVPPLWDGKAAERIAHILMERFV